MAFSDNHTIKCARCDSASTAGATIADPLAGKRYRFFTCGNCEHVELREVSDPVADHRGARKPVP